MSAKTSAAGSRSQAGQHLSEAEASPPIAKRPATRLRPRPPRVFPFPPTRGLADVVAVSECLGIGTSTVWRLSSEDPTFPKPVRLAPRCTRWRWEEIHSWAELRGSR